MVDMLKRDLHLQRDSYREETFKLWFRLKIKPLLPFSMQVKKQKTKQNNKDLNMLIIYQPIILFMMKRPIFKSVPKHPGRGIMYSKDDKKIII